MIPRRVGVHHPFEGKEPYPVRLRLAQHSDSFPAIEPAEDAGLGADFPDAVDWTGVEASGTVWLCLQPDADVFYRPGDDAIGYAGESPRKVVLGVREGGGGGFGVGCGELAACIMEGAELDGDLDGAKKL